MLSQLEFVIYDGPNPHNAYTYSYTLKAVVISGNILLSSIHTVDSLFIVMKAIISK